MVHIKRIARNEIVERTAPARYKVQGTVTAIAMLGFCDSNSKVQSSVNAAASSVYG